MLMRRGWGVKEDVPNQKLSKGKTAVTERTYDLLQNLEIGDTLKFKHGLFESLTGVHRAEACFSAEHDD